MKKHFVTFFSPGTFFAESTTKEIESWNIGKAVEMSKNITERYSAIPYGFQFSTKERGQDDFNSKETKRSNMYYINCEVITLDEIKAENNPQNKILISNMETNGYDKIVRTIKGWKWTQPFGKDDILVVDFNDEEVYK